MPETLFKSFPTKTVGVDLDNRTVRHYVTTPTLDEDCEVLLPRGADISRFRKTGTVFDVHEYGSRDVVGRCVDLKIQDDGIVATTRFTPRPPSLPTGAEWWPDSLLWLYHVGDISGWSVGFSIDAARAPTKKDAETYGETVRRVITRWRMLEYSAAPLPCNEDAIGLATRGMLSKRLAELLKSGKRPARGEWDAKSTPVIEEPEPRRVVIVLQHEAPRIAPAPKRVDVAAVVKAVIQKERGKIFG